MRIPLSKLHRAPKLISHGRLRQLKEGPYTQKEAEAAAGLYTDNGTLNDKMAVDDEGETAAGKQEDQRVRDDNDDEVYDAFFSTYQEK